MRDNRMRLASGVALCAGLALSVAGSLNAQTFQAVYGNQQNDAARGGTIHTGDGGIITVGESQSFGNGDYDVYVVKTDCCGNLQWAATYDIGNTGDDFGRKIRELPGGDFVIVGSTTNNKPCCQQKGADVFVMEIDPNGNVVWTRTYGGNDDDQGTNIELYNGGKELIVSGRTASFGAGGYDGYLLFLQTDGSLIWAHAYGGALDDGFNSLWPAMNGDILAAGTTASYSSNGTDDIWVMRVDKSGCGIVWSNFYGSPKSLDVANDIVEDDKALISVVGYTNIITGTHDPYILKLFGDGSCLCDRAYFNIKDATDDQFNEVAALGTANNLDVVAVGTNTAPVYGPGGTDVLLARINVKCDPVNFWHYGMPKDEEGYSIDVVKCDPKNPDLPTQYIMAGMATSCCFGGEDMYVIRADAKTYSSCCNDNPIKMDQKPPGFCGKPAPTCCPNVNVSCEVYPQPVYNESWKPLCQCCDKPVCSCFSPFSPAPRGGDREHLGDVPTPLGPNATRTVSSETSVRMNPVQNHR